MIGFAGSHRCGKSTLAREVARVERLEFLETNTSILLKAMNVDPKEPLTIEKRLWVQEHVLEYLNQRYLQAWALKKPWIADRTPIDVLAYSMSEINMSNMTPELDAAFSRHYQRAVEICNRHFNLIIVVQPGIPVVDEPGKANPSFWLREKLNSLIVDTCASGNFSADSYVLQRDCLDLSDRVSQCKAIVAAIMQLKHDARDTLAKVARH